MKISNKQKEEIDFLYTNFKHFFKQYPTVKEQEDYITCTVLGKKQMVKGGIVEGERNCIFDAKRSLDIAVKMWREDLTRGMLGVDELKENLGNTTYAIKLVDSIIKSVTKEYRMKTLSGGENTILAVTNFPSVIESFTNTNK